MTMGHRRVRPTIVLAVAWLLASVVLTITLAPLLGVRGLVWLVLQDLVCLVGCGWELHRMGALSRQG